MAVIPKSELLNALNVLLSENTSDEALTLIENVTDTLNDYETKTNDTTNWKAKYEENDATWRQKYKDRFFSGSDDNGNAGDIGEPEPDNSESISFEDLFQ